MWSVLKFLFFGCVAVFVSSLALRVFPGLAHQVFAAGQVGISWAALLVGVLMFFFYRWSGK
jgi:hypothetical protein